MAEKKLLKKKTAAISDGNLINIAKACNNLGVYYNENNEYKKALVEFKIEAKAYSDLGKNMQFGIANRMIGEIYMSLEEFSKALKHEDIYLNIAKASRNKIEEQRAYATIGRCHLLHGQSIPDAKNSIKPLKSAETAFFRSLEICNELHGSISKHELLDMEARLFLNIGVTKEHLNLFDDSMNYLKKSVETCIANDFSELLHKCYITIAMQYFKNMDTTASLKYLNLALDIAKLLRDTTEKTCETLLVKSEILIKMGDFQSAKQILHKCYKLKSPNRADRESIENLLKVTAALCYTENSLITIDPLDYEGKKKLYEKMGDGSCKLQNFAKAIDYYLKMLEFAELNNDSGIDLLPIYVSIAQTYQDNNQYELAVDYLWKQFEFEQSIPKEAFNTLIIIGECYEKLKKQWWDIEEIYQKAREEAQKIKNKNLDKLATLKLLEIYKSNGFQLKIESLTKESELAGIDLTKSDDIENDQCSSQENTPDIGDDICLDELTDSEGDEEPSKNNTSRKRMVGLTIKKNNKGESQLHQACISGNTKLVRRLLDHGHPTNIRDHAGWFPLHEACNYGHTEIVEMILEKSTSQINDKGGTNCDGITPLHDACSNGHLEIIETLLKYGANATLRKDNGETPFDVLENWRRLNHGQLSPERDQYYQELRERLLTILEAAGQKPGEIIEPLPCSSRDYDISGPSRNRSNRYVYDSVPEIASHIQFVNNNDPIITSSDDDESDDSSSRLIHQNSNKKLKTATTEYQSVMRNIRRHNFDSINDTPPNNTKGKTKKRGAYLAATDVDDDWLEDDILPSKKKHKHLNDPFAGIPELGIVSPSKSIKSINMNYDNILNEDSTSNDAFKVLMSVENMKNTNKLPRKISKGNLSMGNTKTQRNSLSDLNYFLRSDSPNDLLENSTNNSFNSSEIVSPRILTETPISSMHSIKVKVENDMFLFGIDSTKLNELNFEWLAREASSRYYKQNGVRPVLQLTTLDGAYLESSDPLILAFNGIENPQLSSNVLDWVIPTLKERYVDMCAQMNCDNDKSLYKLFDECHITKNLDLKDLELNQERIKPIFKALKNESNIISLDLSNNCISDTEMQDFSRILPTLTQLSVLDLSGNFLLAESLKYFCRIFEDNLTNSNPVLNYLVELNLSANPFGDDGVPYIKILLDNLPKLQNLNLSNCDIYCIYEQLNLQQLKHFNICANYLNENACKIIIKNLNFQILEELNMNFMKKYPNFSEDFCKSMFTESLYGNCSKILFKLSLVSCHLNDTDLWTILNSIGKCYKSVEILDLSQNLFTSISFNYLINAKISIKNLYLYSCSNLLNNFKDIDKISEEINFFGSTRNIPENIFINIYEENELEILKIMWEKLWGLRGRVSEKNGKVKMFVDRV